MIEDDGYPGLRPWGTMIFLAAMVLAGWWYLIRSPEPAQGAITQRAAYIQVRKTLVRNLTAEYEFFMRDCQVTGDWTAYCNVHIVRFSIPEGRTDCITRLDVRKDWVLYSAPKYTVKVGGEPQCKGTK